MGLPPTWVCYEDRATLAAAEFRYPTLLDGKTAVHLDAWLDQLGMDPTQNEATLEQKLRQTLGPSLESECAEWMEILRRLRAAGVESRDHVAYLFGHLPPVPKNQLLAALLTLYIEEVPWTRSSRIKAAAEQLQSGLLHPPGTHLILVRSTKPTAAFTELFNALKWTSGVENCELLESFQIPGFVAPHTPRPFLTLSGSASLRLDRLAERAKQLCARRRRVEIYLSCNERWETYLRLRLAFLRVPYQDFILHGAQTRASTGASVGLFRLPRLCETVQDALVFQEPDDRSQTEPIFSVSEIHTINNLGFHIEAQGEVSIDTCRSRHRCTLFQNTPQERPRWVLKPPRSVASNPNRQKVVPLAKVPALSASAAASYASCPAKFFFQQGARLRPARDPRQDLQLYFGVVVHKALELFFQPKLDSTLATRTLKEAFQLAYEQTCSGLREHSSWLRREVLENLFERIAPSIPDLERQLDSAFGAHTPIALEQDFRFEWEGLPLQGRIDRLEKVEGNTPLFLVLDYKTGRVDFTPNHVADGKDFQPWFYILAARHLGFMVSGFLYYDLKAAEIRRGLMQEAAVTSASQFVRGHVLKAERWTQLLDQAEGALRTIVQGIREGNFTPTPSPECDRCDYPIHCRQSAGWSAP